MCRSHPAATKDNTVYRSILGFNIVMKLFGLQTKFRNRISTDLSFRIQLNKRIGSIYLLHYLWLQLIEVQLSLKINSIRESFVDVMEKYNCQSDWENTLWMDRPDTEYPAKARYRISGKSQILNLIPGRIPKIWQNIRQDTAYV